MSGREEDNFTPLNREKGKKRMGFQSMDNSYAHKKDTYEPTKKIEKQ